MVQECWMPKNCEGSGCDLFYSFISKFYVFPVYLTALSGTYAL
jgi:hypothetical protein